MQFCQMLLCLLTIFSPITLFDTKDMNIKGEYENQEYKYIYGSTVNTNTDGLLIVKDIDSLEEIIRVVYDDSCFEVFTYIADIGNDEIIIVCEKYSLTTDFEIPEFKKVLLIKYNLKGEKISQITLDEVPLFYNNHNNYLVLTFTKNRVKYLNNNMDFVSEITLEKEFVDEYYAQYQGKVYINGKEAHSLSIKYPGNYEISIVNNQYSFLYSIVVDPLVIINGEKYNQAYRGNVSVSSKGVIELNGKTYTSEDVIGVAGYYNFKIFGKNNYVYQQDITILPFITYSLKDATFEFVDELVIFEPITIYSNGTAILVNEELYQSELITNPGKYNLSIYGINGMEYFLTFTIFPTVTGIEDDCTYDELDFSVFGNATLNGEMISGAYHLTNPGTYRLDIFMGDYIYKSYNFTITGVLNITLEEDQSDFNYNYIFYILIALGGILILRKK